MTTAVKEVEQTLVTMKDQFSKALPPQIQSDKFVRVVINAIQNNQDLLAADRASLYNACNKAAQDGLLPDGREGAIVVYNSKIGKIAQWMPMIAGLMKKVRNSGEISTWSLQVVKENDVFTYELGDEEKISHKPAIKNRGKTIGAYSIATLRTGEKSREFMNVEEVEAIRGRSRAKDSGPWVTDYDEMCKKTIARRHSKRLPMSTDLDSFIRQDDNLVNLDEPERTEAQPTSSRLARIIDAEASPVVVAPVVIDVAQEFGGTTTDVLRVEGVVEDYKLKNSEPGAAKSWTSFAVKVAGEWYGTFDKTVGKQMEEAFDSKQMIRLEYSEREWQGKKKFDAIAIVKQIPI